MDNIYGTKEAASRLKLSPAHIVRLLESGQLQGKKLGHDWVVLSLDYKRKRKAKGYRKLATSRTNAVKQIKQNRS